MVRNMRPPSAPTPRLECPPGPLTRAEYDALALESRGLTRKERQEAELLLRHAPCVWLWLPGMPPGVPARITNLMQWDETCARYRGHPYAPAREVASPGLRIVASCNPVPPRAVGPMLDHYRIVRKERTA